MLLKRVKGASKELATEIVETIQQAKLEGELATKSDLANQKNDLIRWMIGIQLAASVLLIASGLIN